MSKRPVVVCAVSFYMDSANTLAELNSPMSIFFLAMGSTVCVAMPSGFKQGVVRERGLIKQGVQGLLVDSGFREFHLIMLEVENYL